MRKENKKPIQNKYIKHNNLDKIGEIPLYYGFFPHESPEIKKIDIDNARNLLDGDFIDNIEDKEKSILPLHVEEKIALLRKYNEENMQNMNQPVMIYFKDSFKTFNKKEYTPYSKYCDLEILGNSRSIAEATLIQTAKTILKEEGYNNICVEINSIGDKDSIIKFARDLTNHYKKNINDLHPECRQLFKKDPFELLGCQIDKCKKINEDAPKSIEFLSELSRIHFQEVLEYLEALDIDYKINNRLIGNRKYCTETIFRIMNLDTDKKAKNEKILAIGVRYDGLSKKLGIKKEIQGIGISLLIKGNKSELRKELKKTKKPFSSFVQLGFESKLLSLSIIESLRQVKIPLYLSLSKDRLGAQVSIAEKQNILYSIIMGKKEAIEKTVVVRNIDTYAQEIVSIDELSKYMKKLEK